MKTRRCRRPLSEPEPAVHRRVLVIEDNVDAAWSLKELLELQGHEAAVAADGLQGVAKATSWKPEVVLCDIGLPGIDGYEVARRLRAADAIADALLVALSGYSLAEDVSRARSAGFDHRMAKRPDLSQLQALLAG